MKSFQVRCKKFTKYTKNSLELPKRKSPKLQRIVAVLVKFQNVSCNTHNIYIYFCKCLNTFVSIVVTIQAYYILHKKNIQSIMTITNVKYVIVAHIFHLKFNKNKRFFSAVYIISYEKLMQQNLFTHIDFKNYFSKFNIQSQITKMYYK